MSNRSCHNIASGVHICTSVSTARGSLATIVVRIGHDGGTTATKTTTSNTHYGKYSHCAQPRPLSASTTVVVNALRTTTSEFQAAHYYTCGSSNDFHAFFLQSPSDHHCCPLAPFRIFARRKFKAMRQADGAPTGRRCCGACTMRPMSSQRGDSSPHALPQAAHLSDLHSHPLGEVLEGLGTDFPQPRCLVADEMLTVESQYSLPRRVRHLLRQCVGPITKHPCRAHF